MLPVQSSYTSAIAHKNFRCGGFALYCVSVCLVNRAGLQKKSNANEHKKVKKKWKLNNKSSGREKIMGPASSKTATDTMRLIRYSTLHNYTTGIQDNICTNTWNTYRDQSIRPPPAHTKPAPEPPAGTPFFWDCGFTVDDTKILKHLSVWLFFFPAEPSMRGKRRELISFPSMLKMALIYLINFC